jgi:hypothetical protein
MWKRGQSGNPAGRPPGFGEVARLRAQLAEALPEVLDAVVRAARSGDMQACRLIMERTIAPLKHEELPTVIEGFAGNRAELVAAVVQAIARGHLDTDRGGRLIALLTPSELDERISKIERRYERQLGLELDNEH